MSKADFIMSRKPQPTTDSIQEFYSPLNPSLSPVFLPQSMPRVEHPSSRRPIQLSDLDKNAEANSQASPDRPTSREWKWVHVFSKRRRAKKETRSANVPGADSVKPKPQNFSLRPSKQVSSRQETWSNNKNDADGPETPRPAYTNEHQTLSPETESSSQIDGTSSSPVSISTRKPIASYRKRDGEVNRHEIKVSQSAVHRKSVHLAHTPSNNYQANVESRKIRKSRQVTMFGDFIETSEIRSDADSSPPPLSRSISEQEPDRSDSHQEAGRGPEWGIEYGDSRIRSTPPRSITSKTHTRGQDLSLEHQECTLCGTPNSPGTRYGDQGLWLCTACRSPGSAVEFPPRKESMIKPKFPRLGSTSLEAVEEDKLAAVDEVCENCHTLLPPTERDGILFCNWCCRRLTKPASKTNQDNGSARLTLLRARRYDSLASVGTEEAETDWKDFDSEECSDHTRRIDSPVIGSPTGVRPKPIPPLKDSAYLSRKQSAVTLRADIISSPPCRAPPPPPPSTKTKAPTPQRSPTSIRASFYPDTPTVSSKANYSPSPPLPPPPIPPRPQRRQTRARKASSVYPPTPKPNGLAITVHEFPYPPPPIPEDAYALSSRKQQLRASSVYPDDDDDDDGEEYGDDDFTPRPSRLDWERSPKRNTSFYDYWEVILGDDGKRYTVSR